MREKMVWSALVLLLLAGEVVSGAGMLHAQVPVGRRADFQTAQYLGLGYVVNAPSQLLGVGGLFVSPALGGWGVYADAKFTLDSPWDEAFLSDLTVREVDSQLGDFPLTDESDWRGFNVAAVRTLSRELAVYAGAGYSRRVAYQQYWDEEGERGRFGFYWVEDTDLTGNHVNLLGGAFFRAANWLLFQFGAETAPRGITVGGMIALPMWQ